MFLCLAFGVAWFDLFVSGVWWAIGLVVWVIFVLAYFDCLVCCLLWVVVILVCFGVRLTLGLM